MASAEGRWGARQREDLEQRLTDPIVSILFVQGPPRATIFATLLQVLRNILKDPVNARFRRLRVTNATVQRRVVNEPLVLGFLLQLGFRFEADHLVFCTPPRSSSPSRSDGSGNSDGAANNSCSDRSVGSNDTVLPPADAIEAVKHALYLLEEAKKVAAAYASADQHTHRSNGDGYSDDDNEGSEGRARDDFALRGWGCSYGDGNDGDDGNGGEDDEAASQVVMRQIQQLATIGDSAGRRGQAGGGSGDRDGGGVPLVFQSTLAAIMGGRPLIGGGGVGDEGEEDDKGKRRRRLVSETGQGVGDGVDRRRTTREWPIAGDRLAAVAAGTAPPPVNASAAANAADAGMQRLLQQRHAVASAYTSYQAHQRAAAAAAAAAVTQHDSRDGSAAAAAAAIASADEEAEQRTVIAAVEAAEAVEATARKESAVAYEGDGDWDKCDLCVVEDAVGVPQLLWLSLMLPLRERVVVDMWPER
jgi:hypothetical protein